MVKKTRLMPLEEQDTSMFTLERITQLREKLEKELTRRKELEKTEDGRKELELLANSTEFYMREMPAFDTKPLVKDNPNNKTLDEMSDDELYDTSIGRDDDGEEGCDCDEENLLLMYGIKGMNQETGIPPSTMKPYYYKFPENCRPSLDTVSTQEVTGQGQIASSLLVDSKEKHEQSLASVEERVATLSITTDMEQGNMDIVSLKQDGTDINQALHEDSTGESSQKVFLRMKAQMEGEQGTIGDSSSAKGSRAGKKNISINERNLSFSVGVWCEQRLPLYRQKVLQEIDASTQHIAQGHLHKTIEY